MMRWGSGAVRHKKDVGGITIAQKLETAGEPNMPESAIARRCIDFVLSPEGIAREIVQIARRHLDVRKTELERRHQASDSLR